MERARENRKAFIDGCTVREKTIRQPGLLATNLVVREVLDPDGKQLPGDPDQAEVSEIIEQNALVRFPEPNLDAVAHVAPGNDGAVEKIVVWAAGLYLNGEYKRLPAFPFWSFGLPIEKVLEVLNELAEQGWSVAHVSEDRGLYAGATNQTDSAITTARYLLVRSS